MLSEKESHILMYRNCIADLQLHVDDIDEEYIRQSKAILISGTALAESPSREAAIKAVMLAKKNDTKVIFDVEMCIRDRCHTADMHSRGKCSF